MPMMLYLILHRGMDTVQIYWRSVVRVLLELIYQDRRLRTQAVNIKETT